MLRFDIVRSWLPRTLKAVGLVIFVIVAVVIVLTAIPQVAGADESYVVLSDSMSPTIEAGAVVFVSDASTDRIESGDVITFRSGGADTTSPVTHRVVKVNEQDGGHSFVTKGDANEDLDPSPVPASAVIGKVSFHIPLIGYVISFANTQWGIITLVVMPAVLLIALEIRDLLKLASGDEPDETETEDFL